MLKLEGGFGHDEIGRETVHKRNNYRACYYRRNNFFILIFLFFYFKKEKNKVRMSKEKKN